MRGRRRWLLRRSRAAAMAQRVARSNEKGEREFLDDTQRAREAARARQIIASDCR